MSKIILTKAQAEFIEGFKQSFHFDNDEAVKMGEQLPIWAGRALHKIMQFGFGEGLLNNNGEDVTYKDEDGDFEHKQIPLLIEAVMHGYEIKEENVVLYIEFSDKGEQRKLYYGAGTHVTNELSASEYDLNIEWEAKKVEELKAKGWKVEEVK